MHLQVAFVGGLNRGPRYRIQRAAAVFMRYLNYPTSIGRGHNKPTCMHIDVVVRMCNESAGVKSRFVYRCFFYGRGSMGHADGIGAAC